MPPDLGFDGQWLHDFGTWNIPEGGHHFDHIGTVSHNRRMEWAHAKLVARKQVYADGINQIGKKQFHGFVKDLSSFAARRFIMEKYKKSQASQEEIQKEKQEAKKAVKQKAHEQRIAGLCTKVKKELRAMKGNGASCVINKYGLHMMKAQIIAAQLQKRELRPKWLGESYKPR